MNGFKDLVVYQKAFALAMEIFEVTKNFPKEEKYSLTDQIRRSSRSVCAQIAEAYRRKSFPEHFTSKMTDADAENSETSVWLDFARSCGYLDQTTFRHLSQKASEVGLLIGKVIKKAAHFSR